MLLPIIENASLEGDEDLLTRWANLLVNASRADEHCPVLPSFFAILPQLTRRHLAFMEVLVDDARARCGAGLPDTRDITAVDLGSQDDLRLRYQRRYAEHGEPTFLIDDLVRLRLLAVDLMTLRTVKRYHVSALGYGFVNACRRPGPL
jgi:hypothetical protein